MTTAPVVKMGRTEIIIDGNGKIQKAILPNNGNKETILKMMTSTSHQYHPGAWPWAQFQQPLQKQVLEDQIDQIMKSVEKGEPDLDIVMGSSTPDISHDEESLSDYKPEKCEGNESSGSWDNIQDKVSQLAKED